MPLGARIICDAAGPSAISQSPSGVFDPPERVVERLKNAGFSDVRFRRLTDGTAVVYLARR